jgi:azurin
MRIFQTSIFIASMFVFAACGGGSSQQQEEAPAETAEAPAAEVEAVSDTAFIVIEGNDMMQFNLKELEVTEGQIVKLTLKHVGQMSVEAMGHNWVLLAPGTDKAAFGMAAVAAKESGYIPQDMTDQVIANTEVIGGGEEVTIVFDAPAMGYYDYICSFPGHWGVMQGTLTVNPG